jgi:hypothetical protein
MIAKRLTTPPRINAEHHALLRTLHEAALVTHALSIDLSGWHLVAAIAARDQRDRMNLALLDSIDREIDRVLPLMEIAP